MDRRRVTGLASLVLVLALGLTACGDDRELTPNESNPTTSAPSKSQESDAGDADGEVVEITREGDVFSPNGARIKTEVGEPLTLSITSDVAGELHVHSTPEQDVEYHKGTTEHEISIDRPGVVEVESHDPTVVVLQLEVS